MSEMHLFTVTSSLARMLVPARISSFRLAGSLMNSLICSYSSKVCRI